MKRQRGEWVDYHLHWDNHGSASKVHWRPREDIARLRELREKQQPEVDWAFDWYQVLDWDNEQLGCPIDKNDVYEARKAVQPEDGDLEKVEYREARDTLAYFWTPSRVKACLRAQGMLPHSVLRQVRPQTQWKGLLPKIAAVEYPPLDDTFLAAIQEVHNDGYWDALLEIFRGDVAPQSDRAKSSRQARACELVSNILRAWEAQEAAVIPGRQS